MKASQLFTRTLREAPADIPFKGQQYLVRAGYFQPMGNANTLYLPLGLESFLQLTKKALEILNIEKALEINLPLLTGRELLPPVHSGEKFREHLFFTSRYEFSFEHFLGSQLQSYRQLPAAFYQVQRNLEEQPNSSSGLLNNRDPFVFTSLHLYKSQLESSKGLTELEKALSAYFKKCRIRSISALNKTSCGDSTYSKIWVFPLDKGSTTLFRCENCGYSASQAAAARKLPESPLEETLPIQKVYTPDCKSIEDLANFLKIPKERTAKAVFLVASQGKNEGSLKETLLFAILPGNRDLDEVRLQRLINASALRPATDEEIRQSGAVPGYGSPVNLSNIFVIADHQIPLSANLVAGANQEGYHFLNVNYGRDFKASIIGDITYPQHGDFCPECGFLLESVQGVKLAEVYQPELKLEYRGQDGNPCPAFLNITSLFLSRLLACTAESRHDEQGLILPPTAAPYDVHIVLLEHKNGTPVEEAQNLAEELGSGGLRVFLDDRSERAGVKFNDADLLGIPLRITISSRSLESNSVELKVRGEDDVRLVEIGSILKVLKEILAN